MSYFAFVHSCSGLTPPVFAGEFKARSFGDAFDKASKSPAVKKIVGAQQTKDLCLKIHEAKDQCAAKKIAAVARAH